jgi:hypothetical protein
LSKLTAIYDLNTCVALLPTVWKVLTFAVSAGVQLGIERKSYSWTSKDSTFSGAWRHGNMT